MREREDHHERVHRQVGELLPWYVNGTLVQREREKVESHLAGCADCQAEELACRRLAEAASGASESAPSPHPAQLARLLDRIEQEERAQGGWLSPVRSLLGAAPRPLRGALWAQAAVILVLVGFIGLQGWQARPRLSSGAAASAPAAPAVYRTLSAPAARPAHAVRLRVMFSPTATERELRQTLLGVHGEITAGPSPLGVYSVEVPAGGDPARAVLARLRSEPPVVFAEPAAGDDGGGGQ
jgi:hypothetical protein